MNVVTSRNLKPVAKRMARGIRPTDAEKEMLNAALAEVDESDFRKLLRNAGCETTSRSLRETGRSLLTKLRFASVARREDDLPTNIPRPEKVRKLLKSGKVPKK